MAEPEPEPIIPPQPPSHIEAIEQLKAVEPDALTPRAALELIYSLAALAKEDGDTL
jgi:hypothetical protein